MNPNSILLVVAVLVTSSLAAASSEPRVPRAIPFQGQDEIAAGSPLSKPLAFGAAAGETVRVEPPRRPSSAGTERTRVDVRPLDRLHYTTLQDGSMWASGNTYKAGFGPDGATYVPFFGSQAPRNFPLELALVSATVDGVEIPLAPATSAVRDGDRITIDRGPIDEVYELALDSLEQTFVVAERPAHGDLELCVRLSTEMTRTEDVDGFTYSNAHGSLHYGRAFVREPDGTRIPVTTRSTEAGAIVVVSRAILDRASFPLVVDPIVTTFPIETSIDDTYECDVAYDLSTNRYLVVYERSNSQTDGDVMAQMRDANGNEITSAFLDNTPQNWRSPQVANLNAADQFLLVAQAANVSTFTNWNIWSMTVDAATFATGFRTLVSTTDQGGAKYLGEVGGDSYDGPGGAYYCVTWRRDASAFDWDIHARLVSSQGTPVGSQTLLIDNSGSTRDSFPSISKSNGTLGGAAAWTIAWHREVATLNYDIYAARIGWDGTLLNASTRLTSNPGFEYYPRVSSPLTDGRSLVVYGVDAGAHDDLHYCLLSGTTSVASGSLSALDAGTDLSQDQSEQSVDSDGERFVVAYVQNRGASTTNHDTFVSTFAPFGVGLAVTEAHTPLESNPARSARTEIVSQRSGGAIGSRRFYVAWDRTSGGGHDVYGALYDRPSGGGTATFCFGDGSSGPCPCTNNPLAESGCPTLTNIAGASLSVTGNAQTGTLDTLSFLASGVSGTAPCTLFQGTLVTAGTPFGDGIRCVGGTLIRIGTKSSDVTGYATWPSGAEAPVSATGQVPLAGAQRAYQVVYRSSEAFCTPATFNSTSGIVAQWLP